jgi:hypothetical protein
MEWRAVLAALHTPSASDLAGVTLHTAGHARYFLHLKLLFHLKQQR